MPSCPQKPTTTSAQQQSILTASTQKASPTVFLVPHSLPDSPTDDLSSPMPSNTSDSDPKDLNLDSFNWLGLDPLMWILIISALLIALFFLTCLIWSHASRKKKMGDALGSLLNHPTISRVFNSLTRGGNEVVPPVSIRYESLEQNRTTHEVNARKMADYFVSKNKGKREFMVIRPFTKSKKDELTLSTGDIVVLYKVFNDGWGEGVSRRTGGPAFFPVLSLGGPVLGILQEPNLFRSFTDSSRLELMNSPSPQRLQTTPMVSAHVRISQAPPQRTKTSDSNYPLLSARTDSQNEEYPQSYNPFKESVLEPFEK
jgi:hypothetical protein